GLSFPLARLLVADLDPLWVTAFRFLIGGGVLFAIALFKKSYKEIKDYSFKLILFLAVFEFFLVYFLYLTSIKYLPASKVAALTLTTPIMILAIDSFFKSKFPALKILLPFIFALFGSLVLYDKNPVDGVTVGGQVVGFVCIMLSNLSFAFANVVLRRRAHSSAIFVTSAAQMLAGLLSLVTSLVWVGAPKSLTPSRWGILIYLSVIATGIGFWFWNRSVNKLGALYPGLISNLKAPIAAALSMILIKEFVSIEMWIGIICLVVSATFARNTIENKNVFFRQDSQDSFFGLEKSEKSC
ncbi:EamA family transporter, partial [bacterium]|nr:EamA family transporter [bacterium]